MEIHQISWGIYFWRKKAYYCKPYARASRFICSVLASL